MTVAVQGRWSNPMIVGELVTLRPTEGTDADAMWEMVNDPEGLDLTATEPGSLSAERTRAWCATRSTADERLDLAIVENATEQWAGEVMLSEFDETANTANLRIALTVLVRNPRAERAYQKAGFSEMGRYAEDGEVWVRMAVNR